MLMDKYHELSHREQWILKIAAPTVMVMLIWLIIIKPIIDTDAKLHQSIASKQQQLQWMQKNAGKISATTQSTRSGPSNKSQLRQQMNQLIKKHRLSVERIGNINQTDISYRLDNSLFNSVLALLQDLQQQNIKVVQVQIAKSKNLGKVNTRLLVATGN
ncbi:MAG: type II secretion system protein M [Oceanospirillaceae bacterium]|nr:type II secretion system protein M [Oceanospirillaceae bacterium]